VFFGGAGGSLNSQLLPVPGSPTSSKARSEASVTMARSTMAVSPKNLRVISTVRFVPPMVASSVLPPMT
jgi:hypothetical protein